MMGMPTDRVLGSRTVACSYNRPQLGGPGVRVREVEIAYDSIVFARPWNSQVFVAWMLILVLPQRVVLAQELHSHRFEFARFTYFG